MKEKRVEDDVGRRPVLFLEYYKLRRRLKALYRKKAAYIRCLHNNLANRIIRHGIDILAEKMNYKALQKRSKKTERQEKTSTVKKKDGTTLEIKKYKKKKRYGSSLNNRAPSSFLSILERKCNQYGGHLQYVNTQKMRASRYMQKDSFITTQEIGMRPDRAQRRILSIPDSARKCKENQSRP